MAPYLTISAPGRSANRRPAGRTVRLGLVAALMAFLMSSCLIYDTSTNEVYAGTGIYFIFKIYATDDIQTLYNVNNGNANTTLDTMHGYTVSNFLKNRMQKLAFYISDFDYFFDNDNNPDFATAMTDVGRHRSCLMMHRNPLEPWGDRHNWTWRPDEDRHCINGSHF